MIPANVNPLLMAGNADPLDEYRVIRNSVRTRASASGYLTRTFGVAGDRTKWTYSRWVKRTKFGIQQPLFYVAGTANDTDYLFIEFDSSNKLSIVTGLTYFRTSTRVFRDPSAHFMLTVAVDTNHATANNRIRVYIDDEEITTWDTITNPSLGANMGVNQALAHEIGRAEAAYYFDGYNSEIRFVNAQQLDPSSFGVRHPKTNQWRPKSYAGTYGTNGFYLDFSDGSAATAAALGADRSGNGNNWTPTNISVTAGVGQDWLLDTPTNNFCAFNSEDKSGAVTLANGNLEITSIGTNINIRATHLIPSTGKWYFETYDAVTGSNNIIGGANSLLDITANLQAASGSFSIGMADNATFGFAINMDALTYVIYKNNVSVASGSLTSGMTYAIFCATGASGSPSTVINFGQRAFSYTAPAGFQALCTKNLAIQQTIMLPKKYFNTILYTGNGGTPRSLTGAGFQPDMVWGKSRSSAAFSNRIYDAVRGVGKEIYTDQTAAEVTDAQSLVSFDADGFSLGTDTDTNNTAVTYVAWCWKENALPGFDIVSYAGNGANRTIAHNLGAVPAMMIVKQRSAGTTNWEVWHQKLTSAAYYIPLNLTVTEGNDPTVWNSAAPSSSVFSLGTNIYVNSNGLDYIAYLFAEVSGFSKFGSYTGNGSADGPFVHCGFRPAFVLAKRIDSTGNWYMQDAVRGSYNAVTPTLYAEAATAEGSAAIDFLADGFKARNTDGSQNASGGTYIFMAFAEFPFRYANAR